MNGFHPLAKLLYEKRKQEYEDKEWYVDRFEEIEEGKEWIWPLAFLLFLPLGVLIFACWGCGFFITNELRQRNRTQVIRLAQKSVKQ